MNSDRFGGQTHLILPVALASIALLAIGFAVSALVGTGTESLAKPSTGTLTYVQTEVKTVNGKTVTSPVKVRVKIKHIKARTITKNGVVTTLPASTERFTNVTTLPGKVTVHRVAGPTRTLTHTNTLVNTSTVFSTITNTSTIFSTVTVPTTVTLPASTVTVTTTPP